MSPELELQALREYTIQLGDKLENSYKAIQALLHLTNYDETWFRNLETASIEEHKEASRREQEDMEVSQPFKLDMFLSLSGFPLWRARVLTKPDVKG